VVVVVDLEEAAPESAVVVVRRSSWCRTLRSRFLDRSTQVDAEVEAVEVAGVTERAEVAQVV
jgi:hypothetical protein